MGMEVFIYIIITIVVILFVIGFSKSLEMSDEEIRTIIDKSFEKHYDLKPRETEYERLKRKNQEAKRDYEEAMRRRKMNRELDKYYTDIENRGY